MTITESSAVIPPLHTRNAEQQAFLDHWLQHEKHIFLISSAAFFTLAAYLFVVNPFSIYTNFDDPIANLLQSVASLLPFVFLVATAILIWRSTRTEVIRRKLENFNSRRQKVRIFIAIILLGSFILLAVTQFTYSTGLCVLALLGAGTALLLAVISWWRLGHIAKFQAMATSYLS